jgi:hypothetical protein
LMASLTDVTCPATLFGKLRLVSAIWVECRLARDTGEQPVGYRGGHPAADVGE